MSVLYKGLVIAGLIVLFSMGAVWWFDTTPSLTTSLEKPDTPRSYYEPLIPWQFGRQPIFVSVADTPEERTLGLSNTTALPPDVVKLFVFPTDDRWSFWMKDMHYSIDMVWVSATGTVVHVESSVNPETYPTSFIPPVAARYVIETNAGFVATAGITIGSILDVSAIIAKI